MDTIVINDLFSAIFNVLYFAVILATIFIVILDNRNPVKTMAWILVLFFLPIVGLVFYFFFGQNTRKERLISRKGYSRLNKRPLAEYQAQESLKEQTGKSHLMSFFTRVNNAWAFGGNTVSISITVGSSSGGSSSGGSSSTIDGLVTINNPASKQSTAGEWIAFGDSITYGFGVGGNDSAYPARVASASSLRANNYGESGRVVAIGASGATVPDARSFCNYYTSLPSSASLVTVFGGVNDFLLSVPLGTSSSSDKSTFYGALNVLADGLKSKYGSTRIVFFTPIRIGGHGNANGQGLTLKDYRNAIVTVCNNKGIEVLDLYSLDSMDADISVSNYMGTWDTTHPNGSGHQAIADYIVSQNQLVCIYYLQSSAYHE